MKRFCFCILIFLIGVTLGCAKGYELTKPAGEYNVSITLDKNPPVAGENHMTIMIKDSSGKAVTDAAVSVEYTMPAMPGMPAMNYTTETEMKGNAYHTTLNLSMSGAWNIAVKITRHDKTEIVNFNVDAR
ncbi:MAG TPA: FixH family protein [Thermodesulfobacteriota bacterium]|nr:FixH family protein [Thermodesulfobacteriota bacterium]